MTGVPPSARHFYLQQDICNGPEVPIFIAPPRRLELPLVRRFLLLFSGVAAEAQVPSSSSASSPHATLRRIAAAAEMKMSFTACTEQAAYHRHNRINTISVKFKVVYRMMNCTVHAPLWVQAGQVRTQVQHARWL